jgi:hypothetical protein
MKAQRKEAMLLYPFAVSNFLVSINSESIVFTSGDPVITGYGRFLEVSHHCLGMGRIIDISPTFSWVRVLILLNPKKVTRLDVCRFPNVLFFLNLLLKDQN